MKRLAIITTHPIQYNAPLFRILHQRNNINLKVFYTWEQSQKGQVYDPGFGIHREWDIPLLEGYDYVFVKNSAAEPGSHHFTGIVNPTLLQEVKAFKPDAVLVYGWAFWSHLKLMWLFHDKITLFFRGDSTLLDEQQIHPLKIVMRRLLLRGVYRFIDKALYAGTANKKYFLKHGLKENQLAWVPHVIDNDRFGTVTDVERQKVLEWRRELGYTDTDCVFLFAGKLEPKKNPMLLLEAFFELKDDRAALLIAGNGELEPMLKSKAAENKKIRFIDFQNQTQMPLLYRVADVFVLPSEGPGETWGLAVNEAMACGRAVVVSDQCGCAEDLVRGNGFIFESGNKNQLTELLHKFLDQPGQSVQMGIKSRELIDQWSLTMAALKMEEAICR